MTRSGQVSGPWAALIGSHSVLMSKKRKKLPDEEVWTRWNERMTRIRHELHYVYGTRRRFNDVTALFERNDKLKAVGGDV